MKPSLSKDNVREDDRTPGLVTLSLNRFHYALPTKLPQAAVVDAANPTTGDSRVLSVPTPISLFERLENEYSRPDKLCEKEIVTGAKHKRLAKIDLLRGQDNYTYLDANSSGL